MGAGWNWVGFGIRMLGEDGGPACVMNGFRGMFHAEYSMYLPEGATLYLSGLKGATAPVGTTFIKFRW